MATARYWRLNQFRLAPGQDLALSEIELLQGETRVDAAATLTGTLVPASGALAALQDGAFSPVVVFGGADVFRPGFALLWDFGAPQEVTAVRVAGPDEARFPQAFTVEYSDDGATWSLPEYPGVGAQFAGATEFYGRSLAAVEIDYTAAILALAPTGYWPLDEASGAVAHDLSGNGFHGAITGSPVTYRQMALRLGSAGSMGFGVAVNGTGRVIVTDASTGGVFRNLMNPGASATIVVLFRATAATIYNWLLGHAWNASLGYVNYRIINGLYAESPDNVNRVGVGLSLNTTYFVAWTKDVERSTYSLYVNGIKYTANAWSDPAKNNSAAALEFPGCFGYSSYPMRGYMSDMAIFTRALSDADIERLYQLAVLGYAGPVDSANAAVHAQAGGAILHSEAVGDLQLRPAPILRAEHDVDGGTGVIVDTVMRAGDPAKLPLRRRVLLLDAQTRRVVGETWSHPATGAYAFHNLDRARRYAAIAIDHEHHWRAVIADHLQPQALP